MPQIRALVITGHSEDLFSAGVDVTPTDKYIVDMFQFLQNKDKDKLEKGFAYIQGVLSKKSSMQPPRWMKMRPWRLKEKRRRKMFSASSALKGLGLFWKNGRLTGRGKRLSGWRKRITNT
jgi:hypothetical protein